MDVWQGHEALHKDEAASWLDSDGFAARLLLGPRVR